MAIGCAVAMVVQRNPLYSAIALIGVFIVARLFVRDAGCAIHCGVQVIVYAGAIMVSGSVRDHAAECREEERQPLRLRALIPIAVTLAADLLCRDCLHYLLCAGFAGFAENVSDVGLTSSIGGGLFTHTCCRLRSPRFCC
jgi:NADH:ubiquinone oxidoreductase subunit 6 (subunit J)